MSKCFRIALFGLSHLYSRACAPYFVRDLKKNMVVSVYLAYTSTRSVRISWCVYKMLENYLCEKKHYLRKSPFGDILIEKCLVTCMHV